MSERIDRGVRELSDRYPKAIREQYLRSSRRICRTIFRNFSSFKAGFRQSIRQFLFGLRSYSRRTPVELRKNSFGHLVEQPVEQSWLNRVKRYQLHGYEVVKVADLMISLPAGVLAKRGALSAQRYRLRSAEGGSASLSQSVVRVEDLIAAQ